MINKRVDEILTGIVEILKKYLNPSKIILFGSRAKTCNDAYADFDFAIDVKRPPISKERKINEEIEKIRGLYKVDIVYMPTVDKDFREIIFKTGKVLYERRD